MRVRNGAANERLGQLHGGTSNQRRYNQQDHPLKPYRPRILRVLTDAFAEEVRLGREGGRRRQRQKAWMAEGNGTSRRLVMYNDFVTSYLP